MDPNIGISTISSRSLPTETVGNVYSNAAFAPDEASGRKGSAPTLATASAHGSTNTMIDKHGSGDLYSEVTQHKRDSSTVEFNLPEKVPSRERLRSISDGPYRGMGKEELLRYSSRPLWRNLRYVCMSVVLTGWLALLITVVALVLTYPQCREAQERDWWQKTVVYRIYVRSFHDSDTDGIGDLKGLRQKLDYLHDLGVGTIALSPIYKLAPDAPTDSHIVNHTDIDPIYGDINEFRLLVNDTHKRGMHITMDFIPNHTSDQHPWFIQSTDNKDARQNVYRSYYVWTEGLGNNGLQVPNNWTSVYDCTAWTKTRKTGDNSFYLHQFMESQPELNLRSEKVRDELENILKFWLDMGVDGFYVRDSDYLFEDYDLRDDILIDNSTERDCTQNPQGVGAYEAYDHVHTRGLTEVFDMLARWRAFLHDYSNTTNHYRIMFADVDSSYDHVMNYYGLFNRDGVDFPLNKFSLEINVTQNGGRVVANMVNKWMDSMPTDRWPDWMGGDDRSDRLVDRLGDHVSGPYLIMAILLPGTPYLYYGDEIGLMAATDFNLTHPWSQAKPMRGPMQWNNKTHAGFCPQYCREPWMPLNQDYKTYMNVEAQKTNPESMWNLFRNLTALRKGKPSFEYGFYIPVLQDDEVFSFVREFDGEKGYLVALNFADKKTQKHFRGAHSTIPGSGKVEVATGKSSHHSKGSSAGLDPLTLNPYEGVVVSWDYQAKEL